MSRVAALATVVTLAMSLPVGAVPCPLPTLSATALTKPDAVIEDGGGVIVALQSNFGQNVTGEEIPNTDPAITSPNLVVRSTWRFRDGAKLVAPSIDKIAPGLAVYRLPTSSASAYVLETGAHKSMVAVRRSPDRDASKLGPPIVSGGNLTTTEGGRRFSSATFVSIHLPSLPPRGASLMIAYGADNVARSFGRVVGNSKDVTVWISGGGCTFPIPGEIATAVGDTITVAWLDESGRLSARSVPIEIHQEKQK